MWNFLPRFLRKRTEESAQADNAKQSAAAPPPQSNERFRMLVQGVRDYAIVMLDPQGGVVTWNAGAERIKGYKAEEILGRHFSCLYPAADVAQGKPAQQLQKALAHGQVEDEGWRLRKDGSRFWAHVLTTAVYDESGVHRGFSKITRDMTERTRFDEMLRSVVDHVIDGIITIDEEGMVESFNPAAERMFAYQASEVIGKNVKMLMPEPYHTQHDGYISNYLRTGEAKIIGIGREVVGRRKDGSTFPMELAVSQFTLGPRRLFTGIVRDITERKQLEEEVRRRLQELAEAEERMRSVVNHVVDGIISIDERGTVTTYNPAAEKIFGYTADDVVGQNVKMLMPEPFQSQHDDYIANYLRTGEAKIIGIGREVSGRRKDGSIFPMELAISVFRLNERRYFTGIVRDITQRKQAEDELRQAEERMRSVVDHVIDGIITIDERGAVESLNPAAEKLFGFPRQDVIGQNVKMLMPEPYHSQHDYYVANYLNTGQAKIIGIGREVVGRRQDSSTFPMELAVSEFRIGPRRFFTGIVRDITERKQLELELHQRLIELGDADRQKNEFLAMLAHELRNPLAPIRNALHVLKMPGADNSTVQQARDMMERQLYHLVRLVDDLLDVSRIIRGKIELRKEPVDLAAAVTRAVETAHPVIDLQGHELTVSLPNEPVWLQADLIRLAQIIANLLTNAAKYTDRAGRIWLIAERAGSDLVLRVRDSGIGIPPEFLPHIFDLFVQGDRSLARSQGGLGIGLTLVKRLVEMHEGSIAAFSAGIGQGSEFVVRLPVLAEPPDYGERDQPSPRAHVTDALRRRVLVVDDNVDAAESVAMILRMSGYDVRCVYDGISVLQAATTYRPDVVVLDIGLPGMNGYEVARLLRQQPEFRRTPLVALTGYGQDEDRRRSQEAGFDYHLTKPVDPDALQAFVAKPYSFR